MNIVLLVTPYKNMVTSIGMTSLLRIIGSSIGPAMAGVFMQMRQVTVQGHTESFPAPESYTLIFLMAAIMSVISIVMALKIRQSLLTNQNKNADEIGAIVSPSARKSNNNQDTNNNSLEARDLD